MTKQTELNRENLEELIRKGLKIDKKVSTNIDFIVELKTVGHWPNIDKVPIIKGVKITTNGRSKVSRGVQ